ncbi:hypothetical protein HYS54_00610 [Candidatus Micrarchaeota archaeon]|nr:hypothetical protein [Candidatus Micrarchaeota archaeon]
MRRKEFLNALQPPFNRFDAAAGVTEFQTTHPETFDEIRRAISGLQGQPAKDQFVLNPGFLWRFQNLKARDPDRARGVLSHLQERIAQMPARAGRRGIKPLVAEIRQYVQNELDHLVATRRPVVKVKKIRRPRA